MDIPSAIARFAALVEFLAGVEASSDDERAAAQDARIAVARAMRDDLEQAIADRYEREIVADGTRDAWLARARRLELDASLALVSMRLERAIIDYGHAYAIAIVDRATS